MGKRNRPVRNAWDPDDKDEKTIATNRVCLTILHICRCIKAESPRHNYDELGRTFWPLIAHEASELDHATRSKVCELVGGPSAKTQHASQDEERSMLLDLLQGSIDGERGSNEAFVFVGESIIRNKPEMCELLDAMEQRLANAVQSTTLPSDQNIQVLTGMLGLNSVETSLLRLAHDIELSDFDADTFSFLKGHRNVAQALTLASDAVTKNDANAALRPRGKLLKSGLLKKTSFRDHDDLADLLGLSRIGSTLLGMTSTLASDMATVVLQALPQSKARIPLEWPHISHHAQLLEAMLVNSLATHKEGINVLIYGPPGAGKSEFARSVLEAAGACGYHIGDTDEEGDAADRSDRLASLALSQIFAPTGKSILVLDEAEDIFREVYQHTRRGAPDDGSAISKSWINALLENNRNPVIWITNRIDHMDPAYLRRFTFCLEFPTTPLSVRRNLARAYLEPVGCSQDIFDLAASCADVSPAMLAATAKLIDMTKASNTVGDDAARHILTARLKAIGKTLPSSVPDRATRFDMNYLNVKGNFTAAQVMDGFRRTGRGTLLCSGAPGTGKTQLAAEIARELGRELIYKTAADINSMWYGESERNVARMFEDCDVENEVLFLDEADTLLGARDDSRHRADTAVTAEFLRRVETFKGVFVCATNHKAHLDSAMMRRFMFRLDFLPLTVEQRKAMLSECISQSGSPGTFHLNSTQQMALEKLDQLTPGDFANVVKRISALQQELTLQQWLNELQEEQATKPSGSRNSMGFV